MSNIPLYELKEPVIQTFTSSNKKNTVQSETYPPVQTQPTYNHSHIIQNSDFKQTGMQSYVQVPNVMNQEQPVTNNQCEQSITVEYAKEFIQNYSPQSIDLQSMIDDQLSILKIYRDSFYFGQVINSKRHGLGLMVYGSGRIYEGEWENDRKHGKGFEIFASNDKYDGYYINGKPEGFGRYEWANGESYEGNWINGLKHGVGIWRGESGDFYEGEWKFGKSDGYGVHKWSNGDQYDGQFKNCLKHGKGKEIFANGDVYTGEYVNGKPEGQGEYKWSNGNVYKGQFKNGLRHGKGEWVRSTNGDYYKGEYANDKKCGFGMYVWNSGNKYTGMHFDDFRHGYGEMTWVDGSYYKGTWEKGIQHGEGEMYQPGGKVKKGIFDNNVLVREYTENEKRMTTQNTLNQPTEKSESKSPFMPPIKKPENSALRNSTQEKKNPIQQQRFISSDSEFNKAETPKGRYQARTPQDRERNQQSRDKAIMKL